MGNRCVSGQELKLFVKEKVRSLLFNRASA